VQHTVGKLLMKATTLLQTSFPSEVCTQSYGAPKSRESQPWQFRDSHLDVGHLDVGPVGNHKIYYKGKGGGFPQVRVMVSLVCLSCLWLVLTPKVFKLCTNHFVLVLYKLVWVNEACRFFLVPSRSSNTPLYPSKVLQAKERARLLTLPLFSIWDSHLSPSRS
jgi:hypothetical protein